MGSELRSHGNSNRGLKHLSSIGTARTSFFSRVAAPCYNMPGTPWRPPAKRGAGLVADSRDRPPLPVADDAAGEGADSVTYPSGAIAVLSSATA